MAPGVAFSLQAAACFFFLSFGWHAHATQPQAGDWQVTCPDAARCQLTQVPAAPDGGAPHFLLAVSIAESGQLYGVVTAPLSVYLVPGIEFQVDRRQPFKALYEICDNLGCHAGFKLSGAVLDAFRKGNSARLRIAVSKTKAIDVSLSLKGFSEGLQKLQEQRQ
jgi:invasion protein IalB